MLSNDVRRIPEGGAQYSVMCREDGGVLDDLFTYRLADCAFLTVTNAANHEKDLAWLQSHADGVRRRRARPCRQTSRCWPSRGRGRATSCAASRTAACRRAFTAASAPSPAPRCSCAAPATPARTASSCCSRPDDAPGVWDALTRGRRDPGRSRRARHAAARGLLPPVRQRPERGSRPDRGRPRLVLQGTDRLHRLGGGRGGAEGRHGREARPVRDRGPGHRASGQPGHRRRRGHERHVLAVPRARHRDGVRSAREPAEGTTRSRSTCVARTRPAIVERKPLYRQRRGA